MIRENIINKLKNIDLPDNTLKNIEIAIYNDTVIYATKHQIECNWDNFIFKHYYVVKAMQILHHLTTYPRFKDRVINKKMAKNICSLNRYEMMDDEPITLKESNTVEEIADGIFKCPKCHKRKVTYYQVQTRSADEPMTSYCTCINCGYRWKI